jgi:DNA (cytosine-5)-methyltransferase 1
LAHALQRNNGGENVLCVTGSVTHALTAEGFDASEDGTGRGNPIIGFQTRGSNLHVGDISGTLGTNGGSASASAPCVAVAQNQRGEIALSSTAGALSGGGGTIGQGYQAVFEGHAVRRLTPLECERLQGFPDEHTAVTDKRGKPMQDGPRYKMIGNSMAVPCMRWIGQQIQRASESTNDE